MKNEILYAMSDGHDLYPKILLFEHKCFDNAYYCDFCSHKTLMSQLIKKKYIFIEKWAGYQRNRI